MGLRVYLQSAAHAETDSTAVSALRSALDLYRGDFVSDVDYLWVEPVREDLHRRALDVCLRLAEFEEQHGRLDAAVEALSRAVELDRFAEEVFDASWLSTDVSRRVDAIAASGSSSSGILPNSGSIPNRQAPGSIRTWRARADLSEHRAVWTFSRAPDGLGDFGVRQPHSADRSWVSCPSTMDTKLAGTPSVSSFTATIASEAFLGVR